MLDLNKRTLNLFGTLIPLRIVSQPQNEDILTKAGAVLNHPVAWVVSLRLPNPILPDGSARPEAEMIPFYDLRKEDLTWLLPRTSEVIGLDVDENGTAITAEALVELYSTKQAAYQDRLREQNAPVALNVAPIVIKDEN